MTDFVVLTFNHMCKPGDMNQVSRSLHPLSPIIYEKHQYVVAQFFLFASTSNCPPMYLNSNSVSRGQLGRAIVGRSLSDALDS